MTLDDVKVAETALRWHDSHDDVDQGKRYFREAVTEYYQQKYYDWLEHGRTFPASLY